MISEHDLDSTTEIWARMPETPPAARRAPRWRRALRWLPPSSRPRISRFELRLDRPHERGEPPRLVISTHMGLWPTAYVSRGVSPPVSPLIRYEASRPDCEPAAKRNLPSGSRLKALGTASVDTCPMAVNRPVEVSTEKPAMLLWPRLGTYKDFPEEE